MKTNAGYKKSCNLKFEGKCFVSVIGIFMFSIVSGNIGLLSRRRLGGLTQFIPVNYTVVNYLCNKYHTVFSTAACVYC